MTKIDERKSEMMSGEKISILALKTDQQRPKLVDPGETAFTREALFVDGGIEPAFAASFGCFAIADVLHEVGNDTMVEADFAGLAGIKGAVGIEERARNRQPAPFHGFEGGLQVGFEVKSIMMVASDDPSRGDDKAVGIGDRQNVGGLSPLAPLVGDTLAAFLRQRVAAVQVKLRQVEIGADGLDALPPDPFETAIAAPFAKVVVDRLPTDLFFSSSWRAAAIGNCAH